MFLHSDCWLHQRTNCLFLIIHYYLFITFAGVPTTVTLSGISLTTTAPAPTITLLPILIPCRTTAPAPIKVSSPTYTLPQSTAPGPIWLKAPTSHSCSMIQPVLQMAPVPMVAKGLMLHDDAFKSREYGREQHYRE